MITANHRLPVPVSQPGKGIVRKDTLGFYSQGIIAGKADSFPDGREHQQLGLMDDVFKALADPSRCQLLESLNANGGQSLTELCAGLEMTRQSVSKHLAILEKANVVVAVRRGRVKLHYLNAAPIDEISER